MTLSDNVKAITLVGIMLLSVVAMSGAGLAAEVTRGGDEPTFDPGVGGGNDIVVTEQKPVVFQGEDGVDFVTADGDRVEPSSLIGVSGNAEGQPLELPIPQDQARGQYAINGLAAQAGVTVQTPRITDIDALNQRGVDVSDSSIPEDEILLVRAEWNFEEAEDLDIEVLDENGNEITGDVLTGVNSLSMQQRDSLTGAYAEFPEMVGRVGVRGTGTTSVFLQGVGQFDQDQLNNTSVDAAYWAIDLSDQNAGEYTITVEGWDDLDFGAASQSTTVELTTETDVEFELDQDSATRGQYVPFTIRGSSAGAEHLVVIERDDFRNNQVDERVFRRVEDTINRGTFDINNDNRSDFAWARILVDDDTGLGEGQIDTTYLDDTNVDVNVFDEDTNLSEVAQDLGNPEDDATLQVQQGGLMIDEPAGSYIAGQEIDARGTAQQGIDDVLLYARDEGDWELVDINEDGQFDEGDLISVDAQGEWEERDVVLSEGSDILSIPGRYRLGVIEAEDARDNQGNIRTTLSTSEFSAGSSEQTSILVTEPGLGTGDLPQPLIYQSYNGQIATEDGSVNVLGSAPGLDEVLLVMVDQRGRVATQTVNVDDNDIFEEDDVPLVTANGRQLSEGNVDAFVFGIGRDGVAGDGSLPGQNRADLSALESYVQDFPSGLTQRQVVERLFDETTDDVASDDLVIEDSFRYTDGSTNVETVRAQGTNELGVQDIQPGDTIEVIGVTNRKPDDNTIAVDVVDGPSATEFPSASDDDWNFTGQWSVTMDVPDTVEPGLYTLEADDGDTTDTVTFRVIEQRETANETEAAGNETEVGNETEAGNVSEAATEETNQTEAATEAANETATPSEEMNETESPPEAANETATPTGETNETTEAEVGSSVTFNDQQSSGQTVTVEQATLEDGGFVVIHDESGAVIGSSRYLPPGTYSLAFTLDEPLQETSTLTAMLHRDTNGNELLDFVATGGDQDGPYTSDGSPITDSAQVRVS
jgi:major cell surface glycoprotein (TIGR04216 family)